MSSLQVVPESTTPHKRRGAFRPDCHNSPPRVVAQQAVVSLGEKPKKPSVNKLFADFLINGADGRWAVDARHTSEGGISMKWNDVYWQHVGGGDGLALAADWLDQAAPDKATTPNAKSSWEFAQLRLRRECRMPSPAEGRSIVPCKDVYLEIASDGSITALAPDPALGMTFATTVRAGTLAGSAHVLLPLPVDSKFSTWLRRAIPEREVRELIQEQCGMTLLPRVYSMASWWHGVPHSGKSMLAELCAALQRQATSVKLERLGKEFGLEPIIGASLIIVDEVEPGKWDEAMFKSLVSGNSVPINRKYEKQLHSYRSTAKWIISSNLPPFVCDKSDGVWRRICPIEWKVVFPEDERIECFEKILLAEEGRLILDWMLEGASRIVKRGGFLPQKCWPDSVNQQKDELKVAGDSILGWIQDEEVRHVKGTWAAVQAVYASYAESCEQAQRDCLTPSQFGRQLYANQKLLGVKRSNKRVAGKQVSMVELSWGPQPQPPAPRVNGGFFLPPEKPATCADEVSDPIAIYPGDCIVDDLKHPGAKAGQIIGWHVKNGENIFHRSDTEAEAIAKVNELRAAFGQAKSP